MKTPSVGALALMLLWSCSATPNGPTPGSGGGRASGGGMSGASGGTPGGGSSGGGLSGTGGGQAGGSSFGGGQAGGGSAGGGQGGGGLGGGRAGGGNAAGGGSAGGAGGGRTALCDQLEAGANGVRMLLANCPMAGDSVLYTFDRAKCAAQAETACSDDDKDELAALIECQQMIAPCASVSDRAAVVMEIIDCVDSVMVSAACLASFQ